MESEEEEDDGNGDEEENEGTKKKRKEKGKEKVEEDWSIVGGAGRCAACIRENTGCKINLPAIDKWREEGIRAP